jgi:hypothetical protein
MPVICSANVWDIIQNVPTAYIYKYIFISIDVADE